MQSVRLAELADSLTAANKNILVLDTCTLLDVIRSPFRDTMPIVELALRIDSEIMAGTLPFSLVVPSLFHREWSDNLPTIRDELLKALEKHRFQSNMFQHLHRHLYGTPLLIPDVTTFAFTEKLEQTCDRILAASGVIEHQDQCDLRAMQRVRDKRAPSQKGKQSAKDCQIFEETLEIGRQLQARGLACKVVFASSNETDYGKTGMPFPDIKADLDAIGGEFASSLNYAYHVAAS